MRSDTSIPCGRCGRVLFDPYIPEEALDAAAGAIPGAVDPSLIRCGLCADDERLTRGTRYLALDAVHAVRTYGSRAHVPSAELTRFQRVPFEIPSGC